MSNRSCKVFVPIDLWELKQAPPMLTFLAIAYTIVFTLSLFGNVIVIATVFRIPSMHTTVNYLICNLSTADILMAIFCLPLNLVSNTFTHWVTGRLLCKAMPYLQGVAVAASVTTLGSIAFDRYLAVCRPLRRRFTRTKTILFLVGLWAYVLLLLLPWAISYELKEIPGNGNSCQLRCVNTMSGTYNQAYQYGVIFALLYAAPLAFIAVCYGLVVHKLSHRRAARRENFLRKSSGTQGRRQMRRLVKMLVTVVLIFAVSWLPLHMVALLHFIQSLRGFFGLLAPWLPIIQWVGISNCCVNPWIYCAFSRSYRANFFSTMCCRSLPQPPPSVGHQSFPRLHHPAGSAIRRCSVPVAPGRIRMVDLSGGRTLLNSRRQLKGGCVASLASAVAVTGGVCAEARRIGIAE